MKKIIGIFISLIGIIGFVSNVNKTDDIIPLIIRSLIIIGVGLFLIISAIKKEKAEYKSIQERHLSYTKEKEKEIQKTKDKLDKVDELIKQLKEVNELNIPSIDEFKTTIIKNENKIIEKGGDSQLFSFLKIDSFLKDYRSRIVKDHEGLTDVIDENWLKAKINQENQRDKLEKLHENLEDNLAKLENRKVKGFDANLDTLFSLVDKMKPNSISQIKTMEFYENMSLAMVIFYLEDKKIRYFEIYEAFEKLGVFDSTWQKNVLNKLDRIEIRLAQISNQLTELNQNFISLIESSDNIVSELKEINSGIMTNNMLQAINTYQTWRVNKNTKNLNIQ